MKTNLVTIIFCSILLISILAFNNSKPEKKTVVLVGNVNNGLPLKIQQLCDLGYTVKSMVCDVHFPKFEGYGYTDKETTSQVIVILEK